MHTVQATPTFVRERRAARRIKLDGPLWVRVRGFPTEEVSALPINISAGGIMLLTPCGLEIGSTVELHVLMPQEISGEPTKEWRGYGSFMLRRVLFRGKPVATGIQFRSDGAAH